MRAAIFLDKDGTLLVDEPYNVDPTKMRPAPGFAEGLGKLAVLRLPLIVVSNQPGIALGKFSTADLNRMQEQLRDFFLDAGATLDAFYYCPHHPGGIVPRYSYVCGCRKPAPGLLLAAARRHGIDLSHSWMIGDILDDVEAGRRAGCETVLIDNGNETQWRMNRWRIPQHRVKDFAAAAHLVAKAMQALEAAS